MLRKNLHKIAILPLVLVPTILFGCKAKPIYGEEVTYEDVLRKDVCAYYSYFLGPDKYDYKANDIVFTGAYIMANGALCFDIDNNQKEPIDFCTVVVIKYDDEQLVCNSNLYDPLVWYQHQVTTLGSFLNKYGGKDIYSKDDFMAIKEKVETGNHDLSILELPFEEPSGQHPFYDLDFE